MRNLNTSFIKIAIRFFAVEANDVLRAFAYANPAAYLLREIQSFVRTLPQVVDWLVQPHAQVALPTSGQQGTQIERGRKLSAMSMGNPGHTTGNRPGCRLSLTSS